MEEQHERAARSVGEEELDRAVEAVSALLRSIDAQEEAKYEDKNEDEDKKYYEGHRKRLKERFLRAGENALAPHEILEMLLFFTIPRRDTKLIAYKLLDKFGTLSGIFDAPIEEITAVRGVTENTAILFKLIPKLLPMYYLCRYEGEDSVKAGTYNELCDLIKPYFVGEKTEKVLLGCFDEKLRLIKITEIGRGSTVYSPVAMRKMVYAAMDSRGAMAILAHNHLNSGSDPSDYDIAFTRKVIRVLDELEIRLMDHLIFGEDKIYSMRENGDLGIFD